MNIELRDYFAAKAMQGLYANPDYTDHTAAVCAKWAYEMADAMLAAREAGKLEKKADDGWIQWNGGECPVDPGTRVCVKLRVGRYMDADSLVYRWDHVGGDGDIIAYRGVQP